MMGQKSLNEIRAELEAVLGTGSSGEGEITESLKRFLAAGPSGGGKTKQADKQTEGGDPIPANG